MVSLSSRQCIASNDSGTNCIDVEKTRGGIAWDSEELVTGGGNKTDRGIGECALIEWCRRSLVYTRLLPKNTMVVVKVRVVPLVIGVYKAAA